MVRVVAATAKTRVRIKLLVVGCVVQLLDLERGFMNYAQHAKPD
jgi:hypothetical protein